MKVSEQYPKGYKHYCETELLDNALLYGMTADEFWYDDPRLLENFERKYETQSQVATSEAWLNGFYVKEAIASSLFVTAFYDPSKVSQMPKYPQPPKFQTEPERVMTEEEIEAERLRLFNYLNSIHSSK